MENSQNQKHTISLPILQAVADPRSLRVIVLPTEQCNFRCTYCYEDFKIGHMSKELVKALKAWLLSRSNDLHQLTISWFGGEPMLALPTVLDVTRTLRYAFENQGKSFISGMTTNGYYLNEQNFNSLLDSGVTHFQITLDGPRHIHDRSRILANGEPTFEVIWQNLTKIAEIARSSTIDFHVDLRIHYDGDTAEAISPLVAEIKSKLLTSKNLRFSSMK